MADKIQHRRDTKARWAEYNPILMEGEVGYELDTDQYKLGDGEHAWNDLPYRGDPCLQQTGQSTTTPMSQKAVTDEINNIKANTGVDEYPTFSENSAYAAGDVVNYQGKLYQFTSDHAAGGWTGADVIVFTLLKEIYNGANKVNNNDYIKCGGVFTYEANYAQYEELAIPIPPNSVILLEGGITQINGFTDKNSGQYQLLVNGTVTDRTINYLRNRDSIGSVTIYAKSFANNVRVPNGINSIITPATKNLLLQVASYDISNEANSTVVELPYIVKRDENYSTLSLSIRPLSYQLRVKQYDEHLYLLSTTNVKVSSNTLSLSENCKYIGFEDYVAELKYGGTLVNWGEPLTDYEPFEIEKLSDIDILPIKSTFNWNSDHSDTYPLERVIKKGTRIVIYGAATSATFYSYDHKSNLIINSGDYAPYDLKAIRNLNYTGEITVEISSLTQQNNLLSKCSKPIGRNIYCQYPIDGDSSTAYYIGMIERDFSENKITLSTRGGSGYYLDVAFLDVFGNELSRSRLSISNTGSRPRTVEIPANCAYIQFYDFPSETQVGGTMVNYGEDVLDYEPFSSDGTSYINNAIMENIAPIKMLVDEDIVLCSGKESNVYLDDMLIANKSNKGNYRKSLVNTHYSSVADIGYVSNPAQGSKTGQLRVFSTNKTFNFNITTRCVNKLSGRTINMLDIGSSYIDLGYISERQRTNYENDGLTVNMLGTMGVDGKRHEARSGGQWTFVSNPMGRAVILNVSGVINLPTTGYPGTTYMDSNGIKWTVRGVVINEGNGKLVLGPFNVDSNYTPGQSSSDNTEDYDTYATNMPSSGTLTKTTNDTTGTSTESGDDNIVYSSKEIVYYNPFWNPSTNKLDFQYYINKWGFNAPDIVSFTFGSNDLGNYALVNKEAVNTVIERVKGVIDLLHTDYPYCKILLTTSCYGYCGYSPAECITPVREHNLQLYYKGLIETFGKGTDYSQYVSVVPTLFMIDRKNGFNTSSIKPCSLYDETINYNGDAIHPNQYGFYQFADAMLGYAYDLLKD